MSTGVSLGRVDNRLIGTTGNIIPNASVTFYRQGATVAGDQSGTSPLTVNVNDIGAIVGGNVDTVQVLAAATELLGSTTYNVSAVDSTLNTVTLTGFAGTLALLDDDRLIPTNNVPTLYNDKQKGETKANPLTSSTALGQVTGWAPHGWYDKANSGSGLTTNVEQDYYVEGPVYKIHPDSARYGATFDGSTNDAAALNRAAVDALRSSGSSSSGGAIIECPAGICVINSQIDIGESSLSSNVGRVTLLGQGKRVTFNGTTTAMARIGAGLGATIHDTRFVDLGFDCNNVANSIGIYSTQANEGSGGDHFEVKNFKVKGIFFTTGCQNIDLHSVETYHTAATAIGIDLNAVSSINHLDDITTGSSDATTSSGAGIRLTTTHAIITRFHPEYHAGGVLFDTNSHGIVDGIYGHATVTDLVQQNVNGVQVFGIEQGGATNAINNTVNGDGAFSLGDGGFYMTGNDGTGATGRFILTSGSAIRSQFPGPLTLLGVLTASGGTTLSGANTLSGVNTVSGATTFSAAVTLNTTMTTTGGIVTGGAPAALTAVNPTTTLPATGQAFRFANGTVTINAFSGGVAGAYYLLLAATGSGTITLNDTSVSGGNIIVNSGASTRTMTSTTNETHLMYFDGTNYIEVAHSVN